MAVLELNDQLTASAKKQGNLTTDLEAKIDKMVYKLYNLTDAEIKIIEASE